jgi:hypothetical protein
VDTSSRQEPDVSVLVIQHSVADFPAWKEAFDSDPAGRAEHGVIRHRIFRPADDPNRVVVNLEFRTLAEAGGFLALPALRAAWQNLGVEDLQTLILDEVESVDY